MYRPPGRTLLEQTAHAELAVLADGPWRMRWYWRPDLEAMQTAARRYPPDHPSGVLQSYRPTREHQTHPEEPEVRGRVWRYTGAPT